MKINIADALISVILVSLLIPRLGILGYLVTIYISESFNTVMSVTHLLSIRKTQVRPWKWIYKPLFAIVGATCAAKLLFTLLPILTPLPALTITLHCLLTLLCYLLLLILLGGLEREDLCWLGSLFRRGS